ncbi:hypothetical protein NLX67_14960 [Domibacillus sp. A3M-37]|uniref:hypothetical protein n=1 Tax=Domibacillus sp. A3M-37 TaxID=2962037 RepID=UPI0020B80275|nr:hypothetical protein [Domibacillus sp. A3M-37]MCP3763674.1 hypothetical protein [Domibacillus sp. A3M-37]
MPDRIGELIAEQKKLMEQIKAKEAEKSFNPFDEFQALDLKKAATPKTNSFEDLFGEKEEEDANKKAAKGENDFAAMFGSDDL